MDASSREMNNKTPESRLLKMPSDNPQKLPSSLFAVVDGLFLRTFDAHKFHSFLVKHVSCMGKMSERKRRKGRRRSEAHFVNCVRSDAASVSFVVVLSPSQNSTEPFLTREIIVVVRGEKFNLPLNNDYCSCRVMLFRCPNNIQILFHRR